MPYIFDESQIQWPDDGSEPQPPQLADFIFIPAPQMYGATKNIRFDQNGNLVSKPDAVSASDLAQRQNRQTESETDSVFGLMLPCLREIGTQEIYCRMDGGNDEGFSWVSHAILKGGEQVEAGQLFARLADSAAFTPELRSRLAQDTTGSDVEIVAETMDWELCSVTWGGWLLGSGYGTGAYSFFAAYVVDLVDGTIEEDPDAEPVVHNIQIASN